MRLIFWGVRGSVVRPESAFQRFGGNTPCIELRLDRRRSVLLDAGMGMRWQSNDMLDRQPHDNEIHLLLSHCHWDHIQGLPFSPLMYLPSSRVTIHGVGYPHSPLSTLLHEQLRPEFCPVPNFFEEGVGAQVTVQQLGAEPSFCVYGMEVRWALLSRGMPGQHVVGFRIQTEWGGVAYLTDWSGVSVPEALELVRGCKVLISGAALWPDQESSQAGQSGFQQALELARAGGVQQLFCTHHHPDQEDRELHELDRQIRAISAVRAQFAYEGLDVDLTN